MLGDSQEISHLKIASGFFLIRCHAKCFLWGTSVSQVSCPIPEADNTEFIVPERGRKPYIVSGLKVKQV